LSAGIIADALLALRAVDERLSEYVSDFNKPWIVFPSES
jgi:hypothetical protein